MVPFASLASGVKPFVPRFRETKIQGAAKRVTLLIVQDRVRFCAESSDESDDISRFVHSAGNWDPTITYRYRWADAGLGVSTGTTSTNTA